MESQQSQISNLLKDIIKLKAALSISEKIYEEFRTVHTKTISNFEQLTTALESKITELIEENSGFQSQIEALSKSSLICLNKTQSTLRNLFFNFITPIFILKTSCIFQSIIPIQILIDFFQIFRPQPIKYSSRKSIHHRPIR